MDNPSQILDHEQARTGPWMPYRDNRARVYARQNEGEPYQFHGVPPVMAGRVRIAGVVPTGFYELHDPATGRTWTLPAERFKADFEPTQED